jgi:archaemetzincin
MNARQHLIRLILTALTLPACTRSPSEPPGLPLAHIEHQLRPLAQPLGPPKPGDWLAQHPEDGQTFAEYIRLKPRRPGKDLTTIYITLLGDFSPEQRRVLDITREYLSIFFQTPVELHRELPLDVIPEEGRRLHPEWDTPQIRTDYVLDQLLLPDRPKHALAYLCFTSSDLCSFATRNYVLGEARTWERVGVWSIHRNGDPAAGPEEFHHCLRRTMHIATHETGHILAFKHCIAYECNMNGANSVSETDRHPLHDCPVCLRKLLWNTNADPIPYLTKLEAFYAEHNFPNEAAWHASAKKRLAPTRH